MGRDRICKNKLNNQLTVHFFDADIEISTFFLNVIFKKSNLFLVFPPKKLYFYQLVCIQARRLHLTC